MVSTPREYDSELVGVLVLHCCVTEHHKLATHPFIISQCLKGRDLGMAEPSGLLKVSQGQSPDAGQAMFSLELGPPTLSSHGCGKNSVPYSCRTEALSFQMSLATPCHMTLSLAQHFTSLRPVGEHILWLLASHL